MKCPPLVTISRLLRLAVLSTSLALAIPASAGTLSVTSGPTLTPSTAFQNSTLIVQTLNNASLVRESGTVTVTVPDAFSGTSASIAFTGNFVATAGDLASVAYSFTVDSNDSRQIVYDVVGTATINGVTQRFDSQGLITPGVNQYTANAAAAAPFPAATSGTFSGTLNLRASITLPIPPGAPSAEIPSAAAAGTLDLTIAQGDFALTGGAPTPTPTPTPTPAPAGPGLRNISTRAQVLTADQVMIGGVIIGGTTPFRVLFRVVGNSLQSGGQPVAGRLTNPTLALYDASGMEIEFNDDWGQAPEPERTEIVNSGHQPADQQEPAILRTLPPGEYTAVVRGLGNTSGICLVEAYDVNPVVSACQLANLSTRAFVGTGDNLMIGGAIVSSGPTEVVVRAIGPSLSVDGVKLTDRLGDPTLQVVNDQGTTVAQNDNWQDDPMQAQEIQATGLAPTDRNESAIMMTLPAGGTTFLLRGKGDTMGIGLFEIYDLTPRS